ncbi:MAG: type II toxin-antitoxin system PemK/MazF family toxin [Candidatus Adiutrix sp.]|jgi:mRNA interferase MazF|nr:type II toxin-antitoxin system PemK/MazF family toxin [Candidatus Adiutrix sp.]
MKAGDIFYINFDPAAGQEIIKRRPALVVSDEKYNAKTGLPITLPITNGRFMGGLAVDLSGHGLKSSGAVICGRVKEMDFEARNAQYVESIPKNLLEEVIRKTVAVLFPSLLNT